MKKEPCLSGLRYLFAKEVRDLNPSAGSNPAGSAQFSIGTTRMATIKWQPECVKIISTVSWFLDIPLSPRQIYPYFFRLVHQSLAQHLYAHLQKLLPVLAVETLPQ